MRVSDLFEAPSVDVVAMKAAKDKAAAKDPYHYHNITKFADVKSAEDIVAIIERDCSEMLEAYQETDKVLYRGLDSRLPAVMAAIRPDRQPVQMGNKEHEFLHDLFLKAGLKATRKNSVFCTTKRHVAGDWGEKTYVIFVKDGWSGTVFDNITDDYAFYSMTEIADMKPAEAMKELKELKPRNFDNANDLMDILKKQYSDVIITGQSYLALRVDEPATREVLKLLGIGVKL